MERSFFIKNIVSDKNYLFNKEIDMLNIKKSTIQTKGRREFSYNTPGKDTYLGGSSEIKLVSGSTYHPGQNISISADNTISAVDTKYQAGHNIEITSGNVINALAEQYTAGDNINISSGNVISTSANVHSDFVNNIVVCTQTQYDSMAHNSQTVYLITAAYLNVVPGAMDFDPNFPLPMDFTITSNDNWTIEIEYNE